MDIRPIKTEQDDDAALAEIEALWGAALRTMRSNKPHPQPCRMAPRRSRCCWTSPAIRGIRRHGCDVYITRRAM
jgi:hypothetical protein